MESKQEITFLSGSFRSLVKYTPGLRENTVDASQICEIDSCSFCLIEDIEKLIVCASLQLTVGFA